MRLHLLILFGILMPVMAERDIYVAVLGLTGVGKSTFIKTVTGEDVKIGHSLKSMTNYTEEFQVTMGRRTYHFVDTPGFDDTRRPNMEILRDIADDFSHRYKEGRVFHAILYLHRITDPRMGGSGTTSFSILEGMCGARAASNVIFVSTMWSSVDGNEGKAREDEYRQTYMSKMLSLGAKTARFHKSESSGRQILQMIGNKATPLRMQKELVDEGKDVEDTAAGIAIGIERERIMLKMKLEAKEISEREAQERLQELHLQMEAMAEQERIRLIEEEERQEQEEREREELRRRQEREREEERQRWEAEMRRRDEEINHEREEKKRAEERRRKLHEKLLRDAEQRAEDERVRADKERARREDAEKDARNAEWWFKALGVGATVAGALVGIPILV